MHSFSPKYVLSTCFWVLGIQQRSGQAMFLLLGGPRSQVCSADTRPSYHCWRFIDAVPIAVTTQPTVGGESESQSVAN